MWQTWICHRIAKNKSPSTKYRISSYKVSSSKTHTPLCVQSAPFQCSRYGVGIISQWSHFERNLRPFVLQRISRGSWCAACDLISLRNSCDANKTHLGWGRGAARSSTRGACALSYMIRPPARPQPFLFTLLASADALLAKQSIRAEADVTIRCYVNEIVKSAARLAERGLFVAWCAAHADSQPAGHRPCEKKIKEKEPAMRCGLLSFRWEPNVTIFRRLN